MKGKKGISINGMLYEGDKLIVRTAEHIDQSVSGTKLVHWEYEIEGQLVKLSKYVAIEEGQELWKILEITYYFNILSFQIIPNQDTALAVCLNY